MHVSAVLQMCVGRLLGFSAEGCLLPSGDWAFWIMAHANECILTLWCPILLYFHYNGLEISLFIRSIEQCLWSEDPPDPFISNSGPLQPQLFIDAHEACFLRHTSNWWTDNTFTGTRSRVRSFRKYIFEWISEFQSRLNFVLKLCKLCVGSHSLI